MQGIECFDFEDENEPMDIRAINRRKLLFLDGLGAMLSAIFLGFVLIRFNALFGMPLPVLRFLALIACSFALYSLTCFFLCP